LTRPSIIFDLPIVILKNNIVRHLKISLILAVFIFLYAGCRKETSNRYDCNGIRQGIITNNVTLINSSLGDLLTPYSNENLDKLAQGLFEKCNINATVICHACIDTRPPQSEIKIVFSEAGNTIQKVLDISSPPGAAMKILNVHN
jgi:hypothetical protein